MHVSEPVATDQSNQQKKTSNQSTKTEKDPGCHVVDPYPGKDFSLEEIQGKGKMRKTRANFLSYLPQVP